MKKKINYFIFALMLIAIIIIDVQASELPREANYKLHIRTINMYDNLGNIYQSFEDVLTEEEYNSAISIETVSDTPCTGQFNNYCYQTEYKTLYVLYYYDSEEQRYYMISQLFWEKEPLIKKYDIFAARWTNSVSYSFLKGTQEATGKSMVTYLPGDDNILTFSKAVGITMNLYDNTDNHNLYLYIGFDTYPGTIYVTYQHARHSNITFAMSQSYTISSSGLGGVLYFSNTTVRNYYDGMQGIVASSYV